MTNNSDTNNTDACVCILYPFWLQSLHSMADPKWVIGWCHTANLAWRATSTDYKGMRQWASTLCDGNDVTGPVWACWPDGWCCAIPWLLGPLFEQTILPQKRHVDFVVRQLMHKGKRYMFSHKIKKPLPTPHPHPPPSTARLRRSSARFF